MTDLRAAFSFLCLLVAVQILCLIARKSFMYPVELKMLQFNWDSNNATRSAVTKKHLQKCASGACAKTLLEQPQLDLLPCPSNPILTTYASSNRLGNKIFQYASMWALAVLTNQTAFVPHRLKKYLTKSIFANLSLRTMEEIEHCEFSNNVTLTQKIIKETPVQEFLSSGAIQNQTTEIDGYLYQPYLLPFINDALLRDEFKLKEELRQQVEKTFDEIGVGDRITVGVHVRRTDYICYWKGFLADARFYKTSMQWFRENVAETLLFLIVSDDIGWCRENLLGKDDVVIAAKNPEHDFALLAMSNHTIIDYGSFGFWGAFLSSLRGGHTILNQCNRDNAALRMMRRERKNWHEAVLAETILLDL